MATENTISSMQSPTGSVEGPTAAASADEGTPALVWLYARHHRDLPGAIPLTRESTTLGRDPDNHAPIPESAVSRRHAVVERRGADGCWLSDQGSTNGTHVNGRRIECVRLAEHDVVRIGDSLFRFAERGGFGYAAYRLDGLVIPTLRPVHHTLRSGLLGGHRIDRVLDLVSKVASTPLSCVIEGETGTGKELLARTIHEASGRPGPFQAVNSAALPATLIESELFGVRRGAFTGASHDKPGLVRAAHRGTLFLDEIGDMPLDAQAKLLRVLQEREVVPVGGTQGEKVDIRVVCATHRDLDVEVRDGRFRGDLLARLRDCSVRLPPLRERLEDIHGLLMHFLRGSGRPDASFTVAFFSALAHHRWPYNVRELESAIKFAVALSSGATLDVAHLPESLRRIDRIAAAPGSVAAPQFDGASESATPSPRRPTRTPTADELRGLLVHHRGNVAAVGRVFGKQRMQVHRWMKRYGLDVDDYRSED